MVDTALLSEEEWDAAVADFDDVFYNARIKDGYYVADFCVNAYRWAQGALEDHLRQSLEEVLHAQEDLRAVFVTADTDEAFSLLFLNLHFPMDARAKERLEKAADVVWGWRQQMGDCVALQGDDSDDSDW